MKNIFRNTIVTMIAVAMLAVIVPHTAEAKDVFGYKATVLKQNTWTKTSQYTAKKVGSNWQFTYDALKVNIPDDGYIKIESKDKNDNIYISKPSELKNFKYTTKMSGSNTYYRVIPEGTYLIWNDKDGLNIRYTFIKAEDEENCDRSEAVSVASGKKKMVVFTDGHEYSKWYKIKLNKKKAITIKTALMDENSAGVKDYMKVFGSNGQEIKLSETVKNKTYKTAAVKKGTYYIKIDYPYSWTDPWNVNARIQSFTWK